MQKDIHPQYYTDAKAQCACGNTFTVGSTVPEIYMEVCSRCHPFYTGKSKLIDTAGKVEKFKERLAQKRTLAKVRGGRKHKLAKREARREAARTGKGKIKVYRES